jgi:hypothetical protein
MRHEMELGVMSYERGHDLFVFLCVTPDFLCVTLCNQKNCHRVTSISTKSDKKKKPISALLEKDTIPKCTLSLICTLAHLHICTLISANSLP